MKIAYTMNCAALLVACATQALAAADPTALLDRSPIRSPLAVACNGKPDNTPLPLDPRKLLVPGVNTSNSQAVQFNAFFVDLHNPPAPFVNRLPLKASTCGEFRASVAIGKQNIESRVYFQPFLNARQYVNLWKTWGYDSKPADFDEQVMKRYGAIKAPFRNPYPVNDAELGAADGGSGQLPMGFTQDKGSDGKYNGQIGATCSNCHDSKLGTDSENPYFVWGRSNNANDAGLIMADTLRTPDPKNLGWSLASPALQFLPLPWSLGRGSTDAIGILDMLPAIWDMDTVELSPSIQEYFPTHAAGMSKAPNWWYRAFKPRQFWDGALTSDNLRSEMAFAVANIGRNGAQRRAVETEFADNDNFFISLSPPPYTREVKTTLAEKGAVIYHERDLWANGANSDIPKQAGNGSCASCHGVYAPRYANDVNFLPDPRLKGMAGVITPMATIKTDPQRVGLMADEKKRRAWDSSWFAYNDLSPEHQGYPPSPTNIFSGNDLLTGSVSAVGLGLINTVLAAPRRLARSIYDRTGVRQLYLTGKLTFLGFIPVPETKQASVLGPNAWRPPTGYVAPPLYGAWANAPFFHNGSVPTLWAVLKSSDRPAVWQRNLTPAGIGGKNQGYDSSFASYDFEKLGWKYTTLPCETSLPALQCSNEQTPGTTFFSSAANLFANGSSLAFQSPPPVTDAQIRARNLYNTHLYSQSNSGHTFSDALTDDERWALIEYMKTL